MQDAYNNQLQAAQDAYNKQVQESMARLRGDTPASYDTTGVGGNSWVTDPGRGLDKVPGKVAATDPGKSGETSSGWLGSNPQTQQSDNTWPGYQEYYPQYVNPFGNDQQLNALNAYAKQLENSITSWAEQANRALLENAAQLATTPGGMEAAQRAIEQQLANAISQYKTNISNAATYVINNPVPDSPSTTNWNISSILNLPGIDLPGIDGTPASGEGDNTPPGDAGIGDNTNLGDATGTTTTSPAPYSLPEIPGPNPERVNHVDTAALREMLQQIADMQTQQSDNRINYAVQQGVNDLNRAMEDAAKNYQTQRDQVAADEANALDNQALYAEARGDRGGIGEAQYAAIQNTAAQNRRAVNDAQVKLGTDTARQIADLRAQGEFEKADQLLSIAQSHMSQLANLEQWALGTNVGVDEFNSQLQQWVDEYNLDKQKFLSDLDLSAAQLTGMFSDGTRTFEAEQALISSLANSGNALLQMGVMPSRQQLQAMGMTASQAQQYVAKKTSPLGVLGLI